MRLLALLAAIGLLPLALLAQAPSWWSNSTRPVLTSGTANDYAAANQGQVKNIAVAAIAEMNAKLPGGAGDTLNNTVLPSLTGTTAQTSDYAAVNLGQIKTVAKPIYDRLIEAGYTGHPLTSGTYPWIGQESAASDYALANIGQVKNLFAFELVDVGTVTDTDGDGIPDVYEASYNTNPLLFSSGNNGAADGWWVEYGLDPYSSATLDTDGDGRTDAQEFLDGTDPLTPDADPNAGSDTPLAPSGLTLKTLESGHNELTWTNNSAASGIIIERTEDGANWQTVRVVAGSQTSFTDTTAQPDTVYFVGP
jgi:hypothetical protein